MGARVRARPSLAASVASVRSQSGESSQRVGDGGERTGERGHKKRAAAGSGSSAIAARHVRCTCVSVA